MAAAADDDRDAGSPEIAALLASIDAFRADNARLAARVAELERNPGVSPPFVDDLRPLKSLLPDHVQYKTARRAAESGVLAASMPEHRWLSTKAAVAAWLASTGRVAR